MRILFYHQTCPHPFTVESFQTAALGGTESSLMRVAHGLAKRGHDVSIATQHITEDRNLDGVNYISLQTARFRKEYDAAILLQATVFVPEFIAAFPNAQKWLWLHNMPSPKLSSISPLMENAGMGVIGVSDFHTRKIAKRLQGRWLGSLKRWMGWQTNVRCVRIYNSISPEFKPIDVPVRINQLLTMSAPTKGLDLTLAAFQKIRNEIPEMELKVARPWISQVGQLPEGVTFLGALPQAELRREIAQSLCIFYPQWKRVETFGLVYAEANAMGTPFLANDFGAAREVLSHPEQLVDGKDTATLILKIKEWQSKRPKVWLKDEFKVETVLDEWEKLLLK